MYHPGYTLRKKEFICKQCLKIYLSTRQGKRGTCKKCTQKTLNTNARNTRYKELVETTKMTHCAICGKKVEPGKRFCSHHVSYKNDIRVLLCSGCHKWLHGAVAYKHTFKEKYDGAEAPYIFAKKVVAMYEKYLEE